MSAPMSKFSSHCMISGIEQLRDNTGPRGTCVCRKLPHTRRRCLASQVVCGEEGPLSALRSGRGGALAEQFGSVTRRFPWSVIAIEALSPMVFIHTCRIIIMPGHQYLLGFLAPLFESHRRLVSYVCVAACFCSQSSGKRLCIILFRKRQVATF